MAFLTRPAHGLRLRRAMAVLVCAAACAAIAPPAAGAASGKAIIEASGVRGGLVVHLGCGDGQGTAALRAGDAYIVQGLATNAADVAKARAAIHARGLAGPVSVDRFDGTHLPYVDNLVNLLVTDGLGSVPMAEVLRVLAPGGVAMVGGAKTVKPVPEAIDEWTHFFHGPDNNALARDTVVGPPRHMQWLAGPTWTRDHHADKGSYPGVRAVVSANGRLFYMRDETPTSDMTVPSCWSLVARDGYSGVLLWKKPLGFTEFDRRLEDVWRTLVADGDRVYASLGEGRPLSALDAATGDVARDYPGTAGFLEMIKDGPALFLVGAGGDVLAFDVDTGRRLWQWAPAKDDPIVPLTLAAAAGKVFAKTDLAAWCFSAADGRSVWRTPLPQAKKAIRLKWPRERLIVSDGVVLVSFGGTDPTVLNKDTYEYLGSHPQVHAYGGRLAALSADDGRELWQTEYLPGLESTPGEIYVSNGAVWLGPDFAQPRDLKTGRVLRTRPVLDRLWTKGHHYRCYPGKATSHYIITAKRGVEMFDILGENHSRNNWVRATCRVGVTPCNGLLYCPPHSCGCYIEAQLAGFWALAAARASDAAGAKEPAPAAEQRLERGPAYASKIGNRKSETATVADWPTYRHDSARTGSTDAEIPGTLQAAWRAEAGGTLSPPVVADGRVIVADVDGHAIVCLDAARGEPAWRFATGGRVDSPPTIHEGRVLAGCADGWVYCLRLSDGELVWRFLAAPRHAGTVAREQVESVWPVHGSVLVSGGTAYVAAGRSSYLDGGIMLYGLDPATGAVRCTRRLASEHAGVIDPPPEAQQKKMLATIRQNDTDYKTFLAPDRSDAFAMGGALTDILTADGGSIFMRQLRFGPDLAPQDAGRQHLFATRSLLDGVEHNRAYWVLGTGDFTRLPVAYPWIISKSVQVPYGLMLAFDATTVWGVHRGGKRGSDYTLFAAPRPAPSAAESALPDFQPRSSKTKGGTGGAWTAALDVRPRAMIRTGKVLVVGGETGKQGEAGCVRLVSAADGKTLGEVRLASPPVWDGLAVAGGRLYVACVDGKVVCLAAK